MKIAARGGNRLHAPENTRIALISAWTCGADILELDVRLTSDFELVVAADATTDRLTGQQGEISDLASAELLASDSQYDVSGTFGGDHYQYRDDQHPVRYEVLRELLDELPPAAPLLIAVHDDDSRGKELARLVVRTVRTYGRLGACTFLCDADLVALLRQEGATRVCVDGSGQSPGEQLTVLGATDADGMATDADAVLSEMGGLTDLGEELAGRHSAGHLSAGVILRPAGSVPSTDLLAAAASHGFVAVCSTDSMLALERLRQRRVHVASDFAGTTIDPRSFSFGYARAHANTRVWQDNGVHITVEPYPGRIEPAPTKGLKRRVARLQTQMWRALQDTPFYSGGGVGVVRGIDGDFVAEVAYSAQTVAPATTLEMAVVNTDPGAHVDGPPQSWREQDPVYDPHGSPPFVGTEHDENDGYRINWNLGHAYLNNQYGPPCGDGTALGGDLRLERRGHFYSAYYRNPATPGWICTGVIRNESLNHRVFLRCAAKRWRQERQDPGGEGWYPVIPNAWRFWNLKVHVVGGLDPEPASIDQEGLLHARP